MLVPLEVRLLIQLRPVGVKLANSCKCGRIVKSPFLVPPQRVVKEKKKQMTKKDVRTINSSSTASQEEARAVSFHKREWQIKFHQITR